MSEKKCIETGQKLLKEYGKTKIVAKAYEASYYLLLGRSTKEAYDALRSIENDLGLPKETRDRAVNTARVVFSDPAEAYRPNWGLLFSHLLRVDETLQDKLRQLTKKQADVNDLPKYLTERVGLSDFMARNFMAYARLLPVGLLGAIQLAKE